MKIKKKIDNQISLIAYLIASGIPIPHYCYHNDLSIAGNCRVCLVELKNSMKPVVSCATNAKAALQNNEIFYDSALVRKARENILEFLLLNHPLDCPICDQGGDCDLQDQSLFFGFTKRRFYKFKRVTSDKNLGPIVKTVMTRCIHCTRCVRFSTEIAGLEELGIFGRGLNSEIGTYVNTMLSSELSGNLIDLCPVGALTLKSFPFELRGWDIEKLESVDPTDAFGSNTRVYTNNKKIVQIEPDHNAHSQNTWLTDKGRQFFDSIFDTWNQPKSKSNLTNKDWESIIISIIKTLYIFEHCQTKQNNTTFFIIAFENVSLEILGLLNILAQTKSFIKIRRLEQIKVNNDLEHEFQLNRSLNRTKLTNSTFCLLIATNPRFEGSYLNLSLRQRHAKGNFKCLSIGSLVNLTFPTKFLGSNLQVLKSIIEGNNLICQDFKESKNPTIILNSELFKRSDSQKILNSLQMLTYNNLFNSCWNGTNLLSHSLGESGTHSISKVSRLTETDLTSLNSIYFLNANVNNLPNFTKLLEIKLLKNQKKSRRKTNSLFLDHNYKFNNNKSTYNYASKDLKKFKQYIYIPSSTFYENEETFINAEGYLKRTTKLISKKQTKNTWQILRKISNNLLKNTSTLNVKTENLQIFLGKNLSNFKVYMNFHYQASQTLTNVNFYLNMKNNSFYLNQRNTRFKQNKFKLKSTKLRFWLDDFYNGGKDEYSHNSLMLSNCSKILRAKHSNFF